MKEEKITIRLTQEEKEKIKDYAWKNHKSVSEVIRELC